MRLSLSLKAFGYGSVLAPVVGAVPVARGDVASYVRGPVREWYRNGPLGLEQGFTIAGRASTTRARPLTLAIAVSGRATPSLSHDRRTIVFHAPGGAGLRYGGLAASDARGRPLPIWLELHSSGILL